jgi:threonine/homoserine/homoserine lactone efflux protein
MGEATILLIVSTAFIVGLTGALMPGPMLALTISQATRYGFWAGPLIVLGHGILELVLVIALVLGLSQVIGNQLVLSIVGIIGGLVLIYMGFTTAKQGWQNAILPLSSTDNTQNRKLVFSGIMVSLSNPYWTMWWATIGLTYLLWSAKLGVTGVATFFTSHISADLIWYAFISFIVVKGRKMINDGVYRWFLIICGLALVGLGVYFITSGIQFLTRT